MANVCGISAWNGPLPGDPDNNITINARTVYGGIEVSWTYPLTNAHAVAHYLVYRGTAADFSSAIEHRVVGGNSFTDLDNPTVAITYFYWIRSVSVQGTIGSVIGPASAWMQPTASQTINHINGNSLTSANLDAALNSKIESITNINTALNNEISARLLSHDALTIGIGQVDGRVSGALTLINNEVTQRTTQSQAIITSINAFTSNFNTAVAAIVEEMVVEAAPDTALTAKVTTLAAQINGNNLYTPTDGSSPELLLATKDATVQTGADGKASATRVYGLTTNITSGATYKYATEVTGDYTLIFTIKSNVNGTIYLSTKAMNATVESASTPEAIALTTTYTTISKTVSMPVNTPAYTSVGFRLHKNGIENTVSEFTICDVKVVYGNNATLQQGMVAQVNNNTNLINSTYVVKLGANNLIGGFGLINNSNSVDAAFDVDKFSIGKSSGNSAWLNSTSYQINTLVEHAGSVWKAIAASTGKTPDSSNSAYWTKQYDLVTKPFIIDNGVVYIQSANIKSLSVGKLTDLSGNALVTENQDGSVTVKTGALKMDWSDVSGSNKPASGATRNMYIGEWQANFSYTVGDIVTYGGYGWGCAQTHTSTTNNKPPTYPTTSNSYWVLATMKGDKGDNGVGKVYTITITGGARTIDYNKNNSISAPTTAQTYTATLYVDGAAVTSDVTYEWSFGGVVSSNTTNQRDLTVAINGTYSPGNAHVAVKCTYAGNSTTHSVSILVNKLPDDGVSIKGDPGKQSAVISYFKWLDSTVGNEASGMSGTSTFTWSNFSYSDPGTLNGYAKTYGAGAKGQTLWAVSQTLTASATDTTTESSDWSSITPYPYTINGSDGKPGDHGDTVDIIFKQSATVLTDAPDPSTGVPSGSGKNSGWYSDVAGTGAAVNPLYACVGTRKITETKYTWDKPYRVDGDKVAEVTVFRREPPGTTPDKPTNGSYTFGAATPLSAPSTPKEWKSEIPTGTDPVWTSRAVVSTVQGNAAAVSITGWTTPVLSFQSTYTGIIRLYARTTTDSAPSVFSAASLKYKISDNSVVSGSLPKTTGTNVTPAKFWSLSIPSAADGAYVWVISLPVSNGADEITLADTAFNSLTVTKYSSSVNGWAAVYTRLSRPSVLLPTNGSTVTYTNSGTTIEVIEGSTALVITACSAATVDPGGKCTAGGNITTITDTTTKITIEDHKAIDASTDTVTLSYTVTYKRADGTAGQTIVATQVLAKQKQGGKGDTGSRSTVVGLYQWKYGTPTKPQGKITYTWSSGVSSYTAKTGDTADANWTTNIPEDASPGKSLYYIEKAAIDSTGVAATTDVDTWSTATIVNLSVNGKGAYRCYTKFAGSPSPSGTVDTASGAYPAGAAGTPLTVFGVAWAVAFAADPPSLNSGETLWVCDGYTVASDGKTRWSTPYLSGLRVGSLSAVAVNTGSLTVDNKLTISGNGQLYIGTDTDGLVFSAKDGLLARKAGQTTLSVATTGEAIFKGSLSGASIEGATGTFSGRLAANVIDIATLSGTRAVYTASATTTVPEGMTKMIATIIGGGGGGGRGYINALNTNYFFAPNNSRTENRTSFYSSGGGGGAGAIFKVETTVSPGANVNITIGAKGNKAIGGGVASNGGDSILTVGSTTYTASGGKAGSNGTASAGGAAGAGGSTNATKAGAAGIAGDFWSKYLLYPDLSYTWETDWYYVKPSYVSGGLNTTYSTDYGSGGVGGLGFDITWGVDNTTTDGKPGLIIIEFLNPNGVIQRSEWKILTDALVRQGIAIT